MLPNVLQPSATDHVPVLANEVRESLGVQPGETVVDATFGAGGHAALLAGDLQGRGKLIAIDRDPTARTYFERFEKRATVQSRRMTEALSLAQDRVERLRRLPLASVVSATESTLTAQGASDATTGIYTRTTTVTTAGTSYIVSVSVSWPDMQARTHSVTVRTVRAP